eukprot:TRINITY_DN52558_c0_g1_i1.p1 TRINITY_DN52558_c0_g1~~TRINITY_DN52558_c0_g1_i1.p1  ORF type:complete len:277 (-),score=74.04 TRINITY_DN52558_c0_g1_i1:49-756(-)
MVSAEAAMAAAVKSLGDSSADVRRVGLRTLAHVASPGDAEAWSHAALLLQDPAWPVRWAAVDAVAWLAQGGDADTVASAASALVQRLEDRDWPVRRAAAAGLGNLLLFLDSTEESLPDCGLPKLETLEEVMEVAILLVLRLLSDAAEAVRRAAIDLLPLLCRRRGREEVTASLLARVNGEERVLTLLCSIVQALGQLASPQDPAVLEALQKLRADCSCRDIEDVVQATLAAVKAC